MLTGAKATNRKLHEQSLIQTLQAPKITSNAGWSFIVYEPNSRTPFKPGIVALAPGSQLRFEVDTSRAAAPSVSFQYLESRIGMGMIAFECGGCGRSWEASGPATSRCTYHVRFPLTPGKVV